MCMGSMHRVSFPCALFSWVISPSLQQISLGTACSPTYFHIQATLKSIIIAEWDVGVLCMHITGILTRLELEVKHD